MPLPDRAEIDRLLIEAAERAGFMHPEDVPVLVDRSLLQYSRDSGQLMNADGVIRALKFERPGYLATNDGGMPRALAGVDLHQVEGAPVPDRMGRLHDPVTGRVLPREPEPSPMSEAMRALWRGNAEEHAEGLARLTTSPAEPEGEQPTNEQTNDAMRALLRSADDPYEAIHRGLEGRIRGTR